VVGIQAASGQQPTPLQQANRNKQQAAAAAANNQRKPLDPDAEDEDSGSGSEAKFECPRPDGLFADPGECWSRESPIGSAGG
jgi:hypothetical protein